MSLRQRPRRWVEFARVVIGKGRAPSPAQACAANDASEASSRTRQVTEPAAGDIEDDGPNPLPPAIEPAVSSTQSGARGKQSGKGGSEFTSIIVVRTAHNCFDWCARGDRRTTVSPDNSAAREPRQIPEEILPGERVITPGSYGPITVSDPELGPQSSAQKPKANRRPASSADDLEIDAPPAALTTPAEDQVDASRFELRRDTARHGAS